MESALYLISSNIRSEVGATVSAIGTSVDLSTNPCGEMLTQIVRLDGNLYTAGFPWKPILRTRCNGERISL